MCSNLPKSPLFGGKTASNSFCILQQMRLSTKSPKTCPSGSLGHPSVRNAGWESAQEIFNPKGVAARPHQRGTTPLGLNLWCLPSQGSAFRATLGFETQSLQD